jgi:hypothetical protein
MNTLRLPLAILLVALAGSACGSGTGVTPAESDALALRGRWLSADSLEVDANAVGRLELTLRPTPDGPWSIGGTWRIGDRTGDVAPGLTTPEGTVILGLSGGAQVRGPWTRDVITGIFDGSVYDLNGVPGEPSGPRWDFSNVAVTLNRQN